MNSSIEFKTATNTEVPDHQSVCLINKNISLDSPFNCCSTLHLAKAVQQFITCDKGQSLHAFKVCVFNSHDTGISKQLLWVVVNQLPETHNIHLGYNGFILKQFCPKIHITYTRGIVAF